MPISIIKPKRPPFNAKQSALVVANTMTAIAKNIKVDYDVTTQTWEHRPNVAIAGDGPDERTITVESDIYAMLEKGTKAHMIRPRRGKVLRFMSPFRAKTVPNQIISRPGSQGSTAVFSRGVRHPGTKPRNWSKVIAAKWRTQAPQMMQRAIAAEYGR